MPGPSQHVTNIGWSCARPHQYLALHRILSLALFCIVYGNYIIVSCIVNFPLKARQTSSYLFFFCKSQCLENKAYTQHYNNNLHLTAFIIYTQWSVPFHTPRIFHRAWFPYSFPCRRHSHIFHKESVDF